MNNNIVVGLPEIEKEYTKLLNEIKKKNTDIYKITSEVIKEISEIKQNKNEVIGTVWKNKSTKLFLPIDQISLSKNPKLIPQSLVIIKKIIEYSLTTKASSNSIITIIKNFYEQNLSDDVLLKVFEVLLTFVNSEIFDKDNPTSSVEILTMSLKSYASKKEGVFKTPIKLLLSVLLESICSNKTTCVKEIIEFLVGIIEGKNQDFNLNSSLKYYVLEILVFSLDKLTIDYYQSNKDLQDIFNNKLSKILLTFFNSGLKGDHAMIIKLYQISFILSNKYFSGIELFDHVICNSSSSSFQKFLALEFVREVLKNYELIWIVFKNVPQLYLKLLEMLNSITTSCDLNSQEEEKEKIKFFFPVDSKLVLDYSYSAGNFKNSSKATLALIKDSYKSLKECFINLMEKNEIFINQLNFNLSPEQIEKREMLNYNSESILESLCYVIKGLSDEKEKTINTFLEIFQKMIEIYASIYSPTIRDKYITELCNLVDYAPQYQKTQPNENQKFVLENKKIIICQTIINLCKDTNLFEPNSWTIIIKTLLNVKSLLESNGIISTKTNLGDDVDALLNFLRIQNEIEPEKEDGADDKTDEQKSNIRLKNLLISIDMIFLNSTEYNKESLSNVMWSFSTLVNFYLENPGSNSSLKFCITKLFHLATSNVPRIEILYVDLINIIELVYKKGIAELSEYCLNVITAIIITTIKNYQVKPSTSPDFSEYWSKDSWERTVFSPLMTISSQLSKKEIPLIISNLSKIIQFCSPHLDTFGWSCFIELSSIMLNGDSAKSFELVYQVLNDYCFFLTPYNITPLLSLLGSFAQNDSEDISFRAIELFWSCANLVEGFQKHTVELTKHQKVIIEEIEKGNSVYYDEIWKLIFFKLISINLDDRSEVRKTGIKIFMDIFVMKIDNLSLSLKIFVINEVFFRVFEANADRIVNPPVNLDLATLKSNDEAMMCSIMGMTKIIKAYLDSIPEVDETAKKIYREYVEKAAKLIPECNCNLVVQILKIIEDIQNDKFSPISDYNIDLFWLILDEIVKYFDKIQKTSSTSYVVGGSKLISSITSLIKNVFSTEENLKINSNLLSKENIDHLFVLISSILKCIESFDSKSIESNPQKLLKAEADVFDFIDGVIKIGDEVCCKAIYDQVIKFYSYNYVEPHTEAAFRRVFASLVLLFSNEHFDYESHILSIIPKIKTYITSMRSNNDIVEHLSKNNKSNLLLLFYSISDNFINIFTIGVSKNKNENIWNKAIELYEAIFRQSEIGFKSLDKKYQDEVMKSSQEMEIEVINFIVNTLIPNSLFLSHEIQTKLLNLLDKGCSLDYSFSTSSTAVSKLCITNLFKLCAYKSREELEKEVSCKEEKIEDYINIKIKIAKMCTPILIRRCGDMMRKFLDDEVKSGAMPLSRSRIDEIKYILNGVMELEVYPYFLSLEEEDPDETKKISEVTIMDVLSASKKSHLFILHPILTEFIATKENEIKVIISETFKRISTQMGIQKFFPMKGSKNQK